MSKQPVAWTADAAHAILSAGEAQSVTLRGVVKTPRKWSAEDPYLYTLVLAEKSGEETKRVSAFINVEAWRNNANTDSLAQITKGTLLTVEGYFKPEEWIDKDGVKHNRIVMVANKFYQTPDKEEAPAEPEKKTKKGKK